MLNAATYLLKPMRNGLETPPKHLETPPKHLDNTSKRLEPPPKPQASALRLHLPSDWLWQQQTQSPEPSSLGKLTTFGRTFSSDEASISTPRDSSQALGSSS